MRSILTVNGGSSSIKFAVYKTGGAAPAGSSEAPLERGLAGKVERIGSSDAKLSASDPGGSDASESIDAPDLPSAANSLIDWLEKQHGFESIEAVGHRIVHGMQHQEPEKITPELVRDLHGIERYDPDHLPGELKLIEVFQKRHPKLSQVACYDTAFHRDMPRVAKILPIPRRYEAKGLRRYGFHGLSYAYLMEELARLAGEKTARGRVVLAHLGNGASMAAVLDGKCIDTSMAFTPTAGFPMSTRTGDIDPGVAAFLERSEGMSAQKFHKMANHESGMLGISETSSDMRDLLSREAQDIRAAEAVALFCYQAKKWIGAYAAALGGLDTLVFAGGIGENAPPVRLRICEGLEFLGVRVSEKRNADHQAVISEEDSGVVVRVIPTDEEVMIARSVCRVLGFGG